MWIERTADVKIKMLLFALQTSQFALPRGIIMEELFTAIPNALVWARENWIVTGILLFIGIKVASRGMKLARKVRRTLYGIQGSVAFYSMLYNLFEKYVN